MRMIGRRAISTKNLNAIQEDTHRQPTVCVTFDDAFASLVANAFPIINELQIPVTIFIATRSLGSFPIWLNGTKHFDASEKVMSVSQILELKENPLITFGSHTASHLHMSELSAKDIREELSSSRNTLRQILNEHVDSLALPHGSFNKEVLQTAMEEGYKQIFTLEPVPFSSHSQLTPNRIGRFSMSPLVWRVEFFLTINGAYSWLYTWRSFIRKKN
jgi:peptidoglycan/xylan/chitin deacetylase (PgdA/CDA1 family)